MTNYSIRLLERCRDAATGKIGLEALQEIAAALRPAQSIFVSAHVNPDGDALGSAVALVLALRKLGKKSTAFFDTAPPEKLLPLLSPDCLTFLPGLDAIDKLPAPDWWVLLDTNEPGRAGGLERRIFATGQKRAVLDHHLLRGAPGFDLSCILAEAPATANLVLALINLLQVPLTTAMAQALWVALATDTGWFRFENTGAWALEDAAVLAATGLVIPGLYQKLYEESPPGRVRLLGKVLSRLETHHQGAFVLASTSAAEMSEEGLSLADLDGVVDHLKAVEGAQIIALLVEKEPQSYKVSLRARGDNEVESLARKLGGGGHAKAAGCRFSGTRAELVSFLLAEVELLLRRPGE